MNMNLKYAFALMLSVAVVSQGCSGVGKQSDDSILRPLEQTVETDDLSKYVESVEFIFLKEDSTFHLGDPSKIIRDRKGNFIILGSGDIRRFAPDGEYLGMVGRIGRGPGEYANPGDIAFSEDMKSVLVQDRSGVNVYDAESCDFIKRVDLPLNEYDGVFPSENGGFLMLVPVPMMADEASYKEVLYKFDSEGKGPIDSMIPAKDYTITLVSLSSQSHDGNWFLRPLNGEWVLYKIENGKPAPLYDFDFGDLQVPDGYIYNAGRFDLRRFMSSKYYKGILYVQDTDDQLFFTAIGPEANAVHFVYDLDTRSGIRWTDVAGVSRILSSDDDGFYAYIEYLTSYMEKTKEELDPLSCRIVSEYERQGIAPNDNPLLVKVKFDL